MTMLDDSLYIYKVLLTASVVPFVSFEGAFPTLGTLHATSSAHAAVVDILEECHAVQYSYDCPTALTPCLQ